MSNNKLLCKNKIINGKCEYNKSCTYAHNIMEQTIEKDKINTYNIIFGKTVIKKNHDEEYAQLTHFSKICQSCVNNNCIGGLNCRNGASSHYTKICPQDLTGGNCKNDISKIIFNDEYIKKFDIDIDKQLYGCINGHHLTLTGIVPYFKYLYGNSNESDEIDLTELIQILEQDNSESDEDSEISNLFRNYYDLKNNYLSK
jgi:hypothetical protein